MKFGISERDELTILKYWTDDLYNNILKIPKNLKTKVTEEQVTNLFEYYQDLGNDIGNMANAKEIENRIRELDNKFQKQKEQSFFFMLKKEFREKSAKIIVWVTMSLIGFVLGFLLGYLLK